MGAWELLPLPPQPAGSWQLPAVDLGLCQWLQPNLARQDGGSL